MQCNITFGVLYPESNKVPNPVLYHNQHYACTKSVSSHGVRASYACTCGHVEAWQQSRPLHLIIHFLP